MSDEVRPGVRITKDCILDPSGECEYCPAYALRPGDELCLGENRCSINWVYPLEDDPDIVRLSLSDGSGFTCRGAMLLPRWVGRAEHNQGVQPISTPTLPNEGANCG